MENTKPPMNARELVLHLKEKNIKFECMSEEEAEHYLKYDNNYYNITSYKYNFERYFINGKFVDKYIHLDFAYLVDLADIDKALRRILSNMIQDIEHYLKIRILNLAEDLNDDCYETVNEYLDIDFNSTEYPRKLHNSIFKKVGSEYYQKIFSKYDIDQNKKLENIPLWEFLEIITFGEMINFYDYFAKKYNLKKDKKYIYVLRDIVKIRNAVAHDTFVLNELSDQSNKNNPDYNVVNYLKSCQIGRYIRKNKLSNSRIRQITYTLYLYDIIVTNDDIKNNIKVELNNLFYNRIIQHKKYYNNNELLKTVYSYFDKIIKKYYKI